MRAGPNCSKTWAGAPIHLSAHISDSIMETIKPVIRPIGTARTVSLPVGAKVTTDTARLRTPSQNVMR